MEGFLDLARTPKPGASGGCTRCDSPMVKDLARGYLTCAGCHAIVEGDNAVLNYDEGNRLGAPVSAGSGVASCVYVTGRPRFSSAHNKSSWERTVYHHERRVQESVMGAVPRSVAALAKSMSNELDRVAISRGVHRRGLDAAIMYKAYLFAGASITIEEVSDRAMEDAHVVRAGCSKLSQIFPHTLCPNTPLQVLDRMIAQVKGASTRDRRHMRTIGDIVYETGLLCEKMPHTFAAVCMSLYLDRITDDAISICSTVCGVKPVTVKRCRRLVRPYGARIVDDVVAFTETRAGASTSACPTPGPHDSTCS